MNPQMTMPRRVLLCGHEGVLVLAIRKALLRAGHTIIGEACDGSEALEMAASLNPDTVLLLDLKIPGELDGLALIRAILRERAIPVIVLSAYSDEAHVDATLDAGACGYLLKPMTSEQLIPAIETAIQRFLTLQAALQEANDLRQVLESRKFLVRTREELRRRRQTSYFCLKKPAPEIRFVH